MIVSVKKKIPSRGDPGGISYAVWGSNIGIGDDSGEVVLGDAKESGDPFLVMICKNRSGFLIEVFPQDRFDGVRSGLSGESNLRIVHKRITSFHK